MRLFGRRALTEPLHLTKIAVEPYSTKLSYSQFDCGRAPLNRFLRNKAKKSSDRHEYRVFVAHHLDETRCIGYYALQVGSDQVPSLPKDKLKYLQNYLAFPAIHLAFLAVDEEYQGQGLGRFLLMDVFERAVSISKHVGFYALTLQAMDLDVARFYHSLGFVEYTEGGTQPKMLIPLEQIIRLTQES